MRKLAILLIALAAFAVQAQDLNTTGLRIDRPATAIDGYSGGLQVNRDTFGKAGGNPGSVNTANYTHTTVGAEVSAFEWGILSVLHNYAIAGENVAGYFQANKFSTGPTWGLVTEVSDPWSGNTGSLVAQEIDVNASGPDNGLRIGIDMVLGRTSNAVVAGGSAGLRITTRAASTWTRGIQLGGDFRVGIDISTAQVGTAIRLAPGQQVCFDNYDQYCVKQNPATSDLTFTNAGATLMRLTPGGHLYLKGQVWSNQ